MSNTSFTSGAGGAAVARGGTGAPGCWAALATALSAKKNARIFFIDDLVRRPAGGMNSGSVQRRDGGRRGYRRIETAARRNGGVSAARDSEYRAARASNRAADASARGSGTSVRKYRL